MFESYNKIDQHTHIHSLSHTERDVKVAQLDLKKLGVKSQVMWELQHFFLLKNQLWGNTFVSDPQSVLWETFFLTVV